MMRSSAPSTGNIGRLQDLLQDFESVLAAEYEALRTRDTGQLDAAIARKNVLAAELDAIGRQLPPPGPDLDSSHEWAELRALILRCSQANRANGAAIEANRKFVTSLLDILRGRSATERTYDARGRLGGGAAHSALEKA
ncbi:MAG: flagellar protein FlgN [Gammaproteobacteria bacterium]|nr:flagellar protein FlgN [Gammaproteobacteria bacterium]MBI5615799.1 flagellar protein FlgN [Gammaproteobacteria bacterium]